jgi:PKD repeat protein
MNKTLSLIIIGLLCSSMFSMLTFALSEPPTVEWHRTYGGIGEERTCGWRSVIETSDGGYALVGSTTSFGAGNQDFWLVKTSVSGNVQWNRTYGRLYIEYANSVIQTSDGGYAVAGASWNQSRNAFDLFLVKTDADGNMEWNLTYIRDNAGGYLDWGVAYSIIQTIDGGYIISGSVRHHPDHPTGDWDGWLVKTDANGTVEWDRPYGGGADEGAHDILQTVDGGYIFVGTTVSYGAGSGDVWLVKTDAVGNQQWVKTFGGSNWDDGWSISNTSDGGYIIGGATRSFGAGSYDFWLVKTDANGTQLWTKSYGGINEDFAWSVVETDDGGYALAGYTKSFGAGGSDLWLVKTDSSGNQEWNKTFGGPNYDEATSVTQTSDGGYIIAGYTNSFGAGSHDFLLVKLASPSPQPTPPVANFTWSPPMPITGESVTFNASSSLPGWNGTHTMPIVLYSWDFGDGNTSTGQIVTHTYANPRNYTVTLNVTDSQGLWDVEEKQIQVSQPHGPKAEFTATPKTVPPGETVEFDASASLPGWNGTHTMPITEYRWNFRDGNITSTVDSIIVHTYAFPGAFNVTLTAIDSEGLNSSCSQIILVVMPTFVSISTSSSSTFVGFAVDINGTLYDFYGNGLENEPVVLYYTFPGVMTWFPISSGITDHLGHYYVQWIPTATGYFTIKAEWAGNTTHSGTSNTITLSAIPYQNQYIFSVESNSTISALAFNTTNWELSFTASGPSGSRGYVKITVAKSLVFNITNIRVYLDGNESEYSITSLDNSWLLTFDYIHSTHQVVVDLDINIIPEFPPATILPLFMLVTLIATILLKKKKKQLP